MSSQLLRPPERRLKQARLKAAFGEAPPHQSERNSRDAILMELAQDVARNLPVPETAKQDRVNAAMSIALARAAETPLSELSAISVAAQVLAGGGEFARLRFLASPFGRLAQIVEAQRPFLSTVLEAVSELLEGRPDLARRTLRHALGMDPELGVPKRGERSPANLVDLEVANALRAWIEGQGRGRFQQARRAALKHGLSTAFEIEEFLAAYTRAADEQNLLSVVSDAQPIFNSPPLQSYLRSRPKTLFRAQVEAINEGALDEGSFVLSMATSTGKTLIAELRIAAELARHPKGRVVYLAPYKLLARQVEAQLRAGLVRLQTSVRDLGSDFDLDRLEIIVQESLPTVAVMTPERLDAFLRLATSDRRGSAEAQAFLESVGLLIVDEAQLLGRRSRGAALEMQLVRIRQLMPATSIFALSGVMSGAEKLGEWLNAPVPSIAAWRPTGSVELLWQVDGNVYARDEGRPLWITHIDRTSNASDDAANLALRFRREDFPVLIVETTRDLAQTLVRKIRQKDVRAGDRFRESLTQDQRDALAAAASDATAALGEDNDLSSLLEAGLAYHHAGLPSHLLRDIEQLAEQKSLRAIATTTTVAEGAHLPFRVVIIPHLNFAPRRLEPELYANIVGRSGRVGVSHEGLVVLLGSSSRTLNGYVETTLWRRDHPPVHGRLADISPHGQTLAEHASYRALQSQVLAWLGEAGIGLENQARELAEKTFSWSSGTESTRSNVAAIIGDVLENLETSGMAVAASPYTLTNIGRRARLAGLAPVSCTRISRAITEYFGTFAQEVLAHKSALTFEVATEIAGILFETEEVLQWSLWFRLQGDERRKVSLLREIASGSTDWPREDPLFRIDIELLGAWIMGESFPELAQRAPIFAGRRVIFSSDDPVQRTSDAAEHFMNIAQRAAWSWSGVVAMLDRSEVIPRWIRRAVEYGVPTETATELLARTNMSRNSAGVLAHRLPPAWSNAEPVVYQWGADDFEDLALPPSDLERLRHFTNVNMH